MKPETEAKVSAALEQIINMFETGNLPAAVAKTVLHRQQHDSPSARWSLGNQLLMIMAGTTDARGYQQWQQVGRQVRKGAKAFHILGPATRRIKETDAEGHETEKTIVTGFFTIPMFRLEDTEGEPIQEADYRPVQLPPLFEVAGRFGVKVNWAPFAGRAYGWYRPGSNDITLCTHDVETFFHELGHAVHNTFRPLKGGQDSAQEIVAETVAATLCHLYGFDGYVYHGAEYVKRYASGQNPGKAVMKVLSDVQQVLNLILMTADSLETAAD